MAATAIDSLRGILNVFRDLNSKGIYAKQTQSFIVLCCSKLRIKYYSINTIN